MTNAMRLIKKCVQIILVLNFASTAWGDYATLLIAFEPTQNKSKAIESRLADYTKKLGATFKKSFEQSDLEPRVIENANQSHLYSALNDPSNTAVFWVSHAASSKSKNKDLGIEGSGLILDSDLFDVTPIFNSVRPGLRYLAVIGCRTKFVLDKRLIKFPPSLVVRSFTKKVDAKRALKKSIADAKIILNSADVDTQAQTETDLEEPKTQILIRRSAKENIIAPSVRIESAGKIWGVLPALMPGQTQEVPILIPNSLVKLVFNLGDQIQAHRSATFHIGQIEIVTNDNSGQWLVFKGLSGQELGDTHRLFRKQIGR